MRQAVKHLCKIKGRKDFVTFINEAMKQCYLTLVEHLYQLYYCIRCYLVSEKLIKRFNKIHVLMKCYYKALYAALYYDHKGTVLNQ